MRLRYHTQTERTDFRKDDKRVCTESCEGVLHSRGETHFFKDGKLVRIEYGFFHSMRSGEMHYRDDDSHTRVEFVQSHPRFGHVDHYEDGKHVRTEIPRKRKLADEEEGIVKQFSGLEDALECHITSNIPYEPVMAEDGFIYERTAIEGYLNFRSGRWPYRLRSPMTKKDMGNKLIPSEQLQNIIQITTGAKYHRLSTFCHLAEC
jgi:hypothetical protein